MHTIQCSTVLQLYTQKLDERRTQFPQVSTLGNTSGYMHVLYLKVLEQGWLHRKQRPLQAWCCTMETHSFWPWGRCGAAGIQLGTCSNYSLLLHIIALHLHDLCIMLNVLKGFYKDDYM